MKQNRILLVLLAAVVCFAMLSSAFFVAAEGDHHCTDHGCQVCLKLAACISLIDSLACLALAAFAALGLGCFACGILQRCGCRVTASSLVARKVKFSM